MSENFVNRRKYARIYRSFILTYFSVSKPLDHKEVSQINNISQGGACFSTINPLKEGEEVGIELKTPFLADKTYFQGRVLACNDKIPDLIYDVRVQFDGLSDLAKDVLIKIEQYAQQEQGS